MAGGKEITNRLTRFQHFNLIIGETIKKQNKNEVATLSLWKGLTTDAHPASCFQHLNGKLGRFIS